MTELTLPPLHPGQRAVWNERARFKVLACGRRWGKTTLGSLACIADGASGGRAWWVAPSYKMAQVGWRAISRLAQQIPGVDIRLGELAVRFPNGGSAQVRSADDPQSLRGEGLTLAVLDECAFMQEAAWVEALRPALSDKRGGALFISTPKGHNWFWRAYQRGQQEADWHAWQFPTASNPHIAKAEIEAARRDMPERVYLQEYEAMFLDDAGGVFRRVMEAATAVETPPIPGHQYIIGVDWAKSSDFTVLSVIDATAKAQVALDRFNQIDWSLQRGRLRALYERYQPTTIVAESNSIGEPNIEALRAEGLPVQGFQTTNATKAQIIEGLSLAFETGALAILNDAVQVGELQAYELERLPSGLVRYNAPEGMHDDTVISLALAWWGASLETELRVAPSPYGSLTPQGEPTRREALASVHADTEVHRRWAQRYFCPECAKAYEHD